MVLKVITGVPAVAGMLYLGEEWLSFSCCWWLLRSEAGALVLVS